jgi:thiamine-monophosphate kinase
MANKRRKNGEFEIIRRFFAPLTKDEPGAFALTDDAAVLAVKPGHRLVITTDTIIAGVHFVDAARPDLIAAKSLRVNLSDLAAMGARPRAYTLCLALPDDIADDWIDRFAEALAAEQETFQVILIGGDMVAIPGPLSLTICVFGEVAEGQELRRSQGRPGDLVYVSGTIAKHHRQALVERYHLPRPRVKLGLQLGGLARAATDVSDGLVADLAHICAASGTAAEIRAAKIPLSAAGRAVTAAGAEWILTVLTGGDDYELLFTAPPASNEAIARLARQLEVPLTAIGQLRKSEKGIERVRVVDEKGAEIAISAGGYRHF